MKKLLNKINPHKATGPDNISGRLLKEMQAQIAPILCLLFTKSYESGITPTDWKHANVAPVYKKGQAQTCKLQAHFINLYQLQVNGTHSHITYNETP